MHCRVTCNSVSTMKSRARLLLALGAIVLVPVLLARVGHMAFVSHAVCAAHGELVHDDHGALEEHEPGDSKNAALAAADHDDDHEHCNALATDDVASVTAQPLEPRFLPAFASDRPVTRSVVASRRLRLLAAPKTSPPA